MTSFETVEAPDAKVRRDQWDRYLIPHPHTGKEQAWTRATTIAGTLADRFALEKWDQRNVALGIGARKDLYAQAASCKPNDKDTLKKIVAQALEAAKSKSGANLGTALHRFTERLDAGEDITVPEPWAGDVAAYRQTMADHGIAVYDDWIERILLVPELSVAGTCDRLCNALDWPLPRIGDLKTGANIVRYGMPEIAVQLAIYSRATHYYDPNTNTTHPIDLKIDQNTAIVMHLPCESGTCTIYDIDIAAGWDAVQLALDVRAWRKRKDLAQQATPRVYEPGQREYVQLLDRTEWVRDRVEAIKTAGHGGDLAALWSQHPDIPTFKRGGPTTHEHLEIVILMCDEVEAHFGLPFGPSDPTQPVITKATRKTIG